MNIEETKKALCLAESLKGALAVDSQWRQQQLDRNHRVDMLVALAAPDPHVVLIRDVDGAWSFKVFDSIEEADECRANTGAQSAKHGRDILFKQFRKWRALRRRRCWIQIFIARLHQWWRQRMRRL